VKDLNYYLDHPDEMPDDPALIEKLVDGFTEPESTGSIDAETEGDEPEVDSEKEPDSEKETPPKIEEPPKDQKPEGVLAKDGKNVLPFEVLEGARKRANELQDQLRATSEELQALKDGKTAEAQAMLSEEELETIDEELPSVGKALRAMQKELVELRRDSKERQEVSEGEARERAAETIQADIDSIAVLATWQAKANEPDTAEARRWARAVEFDKELQQDSDWKDKPRADRFQEAVRLTQLRFGDAIQKQDETPNPPKTEPITAKKPAKEAPLSLSDMPGGTPPVTDTKNVDGLSLYAAMDRMSDAEISALLQRTG
jgi:hypothetical protein